MGINLGTGPWSLCSLCWQTFFIFFVLFYFFGAGAVDFGVLSLRRAPDWTPWCPWPPMPRVSPRSPSGRAGGILSGVVGCAQGGSGAPQFHALLAGCLRLKATKPGGCLRGSGARKPPWEVQVSTHPKGVQRLDPSILGCRHPQIFSTHLMWLGLGWPNPRIWDLQRLQDGTVGLEHAIFTQNPQISSARWEKHTVGRWSPKVAQGTVQGSLFCSPL